MSRLVPLLALLASVGCIEDHLTVDITTRVLADGSCQRRTEYRLERVDTEKDGARVPIKPEEDPLRLLHRFPAREPWRVDDQPSADAHVVVVEAQLPSPNDIDGDYWRVRQPGAPGAAHNRVSFAMREDTGTYEYSEVFVDPASPLAGMRRLAQALPREDGAFADALQRSLEKERVSGGTVRRIYRDHATAMANEILAVTSPKLFGPRQRQLMEEALDRLGDKKQREDLLAALAPALPGVDGVTLGKALDSALDAVSERLVAQLKKDGLPLPGEFEEPVSTVRYRVTLVMPGPIVRANTCAQGDTATWEFDQSDLYGRGFEMWARAAAVR